MLDTLKNKDHLFSLLKDLPLFQQCSDDVIRHFCAQSAFLQQGKGAHLFTQDNAATHFYLILDGWVKLYRETEDGEQAIIDVITRHHFFGETSLFNNMHYTYSAEATDPSFLVSFPIELLKKEIEQNQGLSWAMMSHMATNTRLQDREIEHRTLQNAAQRIGCFVLRMAKDFHAEPYVLNLPYDKTLVAQKLGMQPETFSRALKKLSDHTDLVVKGSAIEIHSFKSLTDFSCAACSSDFVCDDI